MRTAVSEDARRRYDMDTELAGRVDELLEQARMAEDELRAAEDRRADLDERHRLGEELDAALTTAMRAAYAAQRVAIGPAGYDDRIVRRKKMATAPVAAWTAQAERLLTMREQHRLTGVARIPLDYAGG